MSAASAHPYSRLPAAACWKTAVAERAAGQPFEGLWKPRFELHPRTRFATAGSCFAQRISRWLRTHGCTWVDSEPAPAGLSSAEVEAGGWGVFTFRTANLYAGLQSGPRCYESNLRSVRPEGVDFVMRHFAAGLGLPDTAAAASAATACPAPAAAQVAQVPQRAQGAQGAKAERPGRRRCVAGRRRDRLRGRTARGLCRGLARHVLTEAGCEVVSVRELTGISGFDGREARYYRPEPDAHDQVDWIRGSEA